LLLDEQATQIFAMTDAIAERARKIGATTIHSISDIARNQRKSFPRYSGGRRSFAIRRSDGYPRLRERCLPCWCGYAGGWCGMDRSHVEL
jgi:hypothetical protein